MEIFYINKVNWNRIIFSLAFFINNLVWENVLNKSNNRKILIKSIFDSNFWWTVWLKSSLLSLWMFQSVCNILTVQEKNILPFSFSHTEKYLKPWDGTIENISIWLNLPYEIFTYSTIFKLSFYNIMKLVWNEPSYSMGLFLVIYLSWVVVAIFCFYALFYI